MARYIVRLKPKRIHANAGREERKTVTGDIISILENNQTCGAEVLKSEWIAKHGTAADFPGVYVVIQALGISKLNSRRLLHPEFKNHDTQIDPDTGELLREIKRHRSWGIRYLQFKAALPAPKRAELNENGYVEINFSFLNPFIARKRDGVIFDPDGNS